MTPPPGPADTAHAFVRTTEMHRNISCSENCCRPSLLLITRTTFSPYTSRSVGLNRSLCWAESVDRTSSPPNNIRSTITTWYSWAGLPVLATRTRTPALLKAPHSGWCCGDPQQSGPQQGNPQPGQSGVVWLTRL